jgi:hypothetical protein
VAPPSSPTTASRAVVGYVTVGGASLLLGILGTIPFVILGYALVQWVFAPLGLAVPDSSNNDGVTVLLVAGVLLPLLVVGAWVAVTRWLTRRLALVRPVGWLLALVGLVLPVVVFVVAKSA